MATSEDLHLATCEDFLMATDTASNHFHQMVIGCFARAGVETSERHRGLHALRHSAAVGMLESGTAYSVIGAVLGHADANTTRRYLRVDVAHLRPLALEVPDGR